MKGAVESGIRNPWIRTALSAPGFVAEHGGAIPHRRLQTAPLAPQGRDHGKRARQG